MSTSAWIMLAAAVLLLGGGLGICIAIAVKVDRQKRDKGISFHDENA